MTAAAPHRRNSVLPALEESIKYLISIFDQITDNRKSTLKQLTSFIQNGIDTDRKVNISMIK